MQHTQKKSHVSWLLIGAIIGAGLAATGLVEDCLSPMENTIVATVDGESIAVSHFTNYLEALRDYLADLKASADIRINKPLLLQWETLSERE